MSNTKKFRFALLASAIAVLTVPGQVNAQTTPTPSRPVTDELGVDLATGTIAAASKDVSIGNLSFENIWSGPVDETTFTNAVLDNALSAVVFINGNSVLFVRQPDDSYKPELANGARLTIANGTALYVAPDGTRYEYLTTPPTDGGGLQNQRGTNQSWYRLSRIVAPNGEIRTWNYRQETVGSNCGRFGICQSSTNYLRVQSVTTNTGLMLKANYATNTPGADFSKLTSVQAINRAVDYCDANADACSNLTQPWPTLSISISTDPNGNQQKLLSTLGGDFLARISATGLLAVNSDNQNNDDWSVSRYPDGMIYQIVRHGVATTYSYARSGDQLTVTRTGPNNMVDTFVIRSSSALPTRLESKTDELNNTTTYGYDSENRLYLVTAPEGDATQTSYDPIGRIVEVRNRAKPGSGLPDLVSTAGYVANCTVDGVKYCMKPVWTQDARGNRTDITYSNDHGEATRVQLPAPTAGAPRPEINATYAPFYAKVRNQAGALVDADSPVWKLTRQTQCATAATCAGSASEQVTALEYAASGGGLNLLPTRITVSAGDGSVSSSVDYTYDSADNVI
ncbi:MAG: hypothetical protein K2W81_00310, partial [Sphingomonas sp.]|nr:hypothetical protein [Sphingomonas sp.]